MGGINSASEPNRVTFGGITFPKDLVKGYTCMMGGIQNSVLLQDGTVIKYNDQKNKNAKVIFGIDNATGKKGIKFTNCDIVELEGSSNKDYYYLENSGALKVRLNDGQADEIKLVYDRAVLPTRVTRDSKDTYSEIDLNRDAYSRNEGWWTEQSYTDK